MSGISSLVLSGTYRDSLFLMRLSRRLSLGAGVQQVCAMMATDRNKEMLARSGLLTPEIEAAGPDDLAVAIDAATDSLNAVLAAAQELISQPEPFGDNRADLHPARLSRPGTGKTVTMISVPGEYACYESARALGSGSDVFLYSGGIAREDEVTLKQLAARKGVLLMGPECGTALVAGVPLGFANHVRRGEIGIVSFSGTGIQEVSCLLDRCGLGVSSAYGTGGRDMADEIGGISTLAALRRLAEDPLTRLVLVIGAEPGERTRKKLIAEYAKTGKPVFIRYFGTPDCSLERDAGIRVAQDLTDLVRIAVQRLAPVLDVSEMARPCPCPPGAGQARGGVKTGFLRGVFSGGALCRDAVAKMQALAPEGCAISSNVKIPGVEYQAGTCPCKNHCFLDAGAVEFTIGRPHPLVSPEMKMERIITELCDPTTSVVLTDIVLGYGVAKNQAALLAQAMDKAAVLSSNKSRAVKVVASVCGTENDEPSRTSQLALLRDAGVIVAGNNAQAAEFAVSAARGCL